MDKNEESEGSWWKTVPGTLTAVGSAIAAIATLIGSLHQAGLLGIGHIKNPDPVSQKPPIITKEFTISKAGGNPGTQSSPQLDEDVTFESTGDLRMKFEIDRGGCSEIRLHLALDGTSIKETPFFDDTTGILDIGPVTSGEHTLKLSPEGHEGGCNTGYLSSWGGKLTLYVSD